MPSREPKLFGALFVATQTGVWLPLRFDDFTIAETDPNSVAAETLAATRKALRV